MTVEEKEKIKTLYASGESYRAIARAIGKAPNTIKHYLKSSPAVMQEVEEKKKDLVALYETLAERMVSSISDNDIAKINALQRTIASATAVDKARLLQGRSTSNNVNINVELSDQRYQEFLKLYGNKGAGDE